MKVSVDEREIHITRSGKDDFYEVYTTDTRYINKIEKLGIEPIDVSYCEGEVFSKKYRLTEKQILFRREPKKRELSEEQKQTLVERMRNIKKSNTTGNN